MLANRGAAMGLSPAALVVVATPIGNLGDLTPRAREALALADRICCEDTRRTRSLLSALGIEAAGRLVAVHEHNEAARCAEVVAWVGAGETVVLVSDAGTPLVSDPGARLVEAVLDAGLEVTTTPGPSALVAAVSVAGIAAERFCFEGFLPRRGAERRVRLARIAAEDRAVVLYESPRRVAATLAELAHICDPGRLVAVVRELTKLHEELRRGPLGEVAAALAGKELLGEVVIVLEGATAEGEVSDAVLRGAVADALARGLSVRDAADAAAAATGAARRAAYAIALEGQAT